MKQHEVKQRLVNDWLQKADTDLGVADHLVAEGALFPSAIAFHCQQAAEKCLKAYLVWNELDFPKTHDIEALLNLVKSADPELADRLKDSVALTLYGVELRYPGDRPDATAEEAEEALRLAHMVCEAVNQAIDSSS